MLQCFALVKYAMRIEEVINTIKPIKPKTPAQARLSALQQQVKTSQQQLRSERDAQRRQREMKRTQAQQH